MKRTLLLVISILITIAVAAQSNDELKKSSKGYFNLSQFSFLVGEENEESAAKSNSVPSVTIINGYRFNEYFSIGAGLGMTAFSYTVFSFFADFRVSILKENFSPVFAFKGGYAFANNDKEIFQTSYYDVSYKNTGGWMCNPEIGFKLTMNERADFMLTFGYYYQKLESEMKQKSTSYPMTHNRTTNVNRLSFTIGFLFK